MKAFMMTTGLVALGLVVSACGMLDGERRQRGDMPASGDQRAGRATEAGTDAVRQVQRRLNQLGFNAGQEDGVLSARTRRALLDFQQAQGLQADGQLGPQTYAALGVDQNSAGGSGSDTGSRGGAK